MLYKIASKKKKKVGAGDVVVGLAAPSIVSGVATTGITKGMMHVAKNHPTLTEDRIKEIYKHVGGKKTLQFHLWQDVKDPHNTLKVDTFAHSPLHSAYFNKHIPGYLDRTPKILISKNTPESVVAHELGHSTSPFINNKLGLRTYLGSKLLGMATPSVTGIRYAVARARGEDKKTLDKIKTQNDIAAAITSLPMVGEETRANLVALRAMKRMGQLNRKTILPIALSELSYLSVPAATPLSHKLIDAYYNWKDKKRLAKK